MPPGLVDPDELVGRALVVGREHHADGAQHDVERSCRGPGAASASPSTNVDVQVLGRGPLASLLEQVRRVVDAGRVREPAGGGERRVALPARDVEHALTRAYVGRLDELLGDDLQRVADARVVAGLPARRAGPALIASKSVVEAVVVVMFVAPWSMVVDQGLRGAV